MVKGTGFNPNPQTLEYPNLKGFFYLILASLIWGTSPPATEFALNSFSPQIIIFFRFFLSSLILSFIVRKTPLISAATILLGTLNALAHEFQFTGQVYTTASKVAIISNTFPIYVGILAPIVLRERIFLNNIISIFLGTLGVLLVGNVFEFKGINFGDFLAFLASIVYAFYVVIAKRFSLQIEPIYYTFSTNFISVFVAFLFLPITFKFNPDISSSLSVLWLAVFPSSFGYIFYFYGLKFKGAVSSSVIILSTIVFGTVLSILMLGESLNILETLGLLLVSIGVLLAK